jgi:hypothetical protein
MGSFIILQLPATFQPYGGNGHNYDGYKQQVEAKD